MAQIELIKNVFKPDLFNVYLNEDVYFISSISGQSCIQFRIDTNYILISELDKCSSASGSDLLKLMDQLAESMPNINYISLIDASRIITKCGDEDNPVAISMSPLKILTKGMSWYNAHGYISPNFQDEQKHNNEIIQTSLNHLIPGKIIEVFMENNSVINITSQLKRATERSIQRGVNPEHNSNVSYYKDILENYKHFIDEKTGSIITKCEKIKQNADELFPHINMELPTGIYVKEILDSIGNRFDGSDVETCKKYKFISKLIDEIDGLLYNDCSQLTKTIRQPTTGGKNKKQSTMKKSKKSKKNKKSKKSKKSKKRKKQYKI